MRQCFNDLTTQRYNNREQKASILATFFHCNSTAIGEKCVLARWDEAEPCVYKAQSFMRLSTV